jgi:hypothetical protein
MEFYVNYDCDINSSNIFEAIVEILSKITQGIYSKSDYRKTISKEQEEILKFKALLCLHLLLKSLFNYVQDYHAQQIQNQAHALEQSDQPDESELVRQDSDALGNFQYAELETIEDT